RMTKSGSIARTPPDERSRTRSDTARTGHAREHSHENRRSFSVNDVAKAAGADTLPTAGKASAPNKSAPAAPPIRTLCAICLCESVDDTSELTACDKATAAAPLAVTAVCEVACDCGSGRLRKYTSA